ncbi:MAG: four helix bundle protein [Planctomycetota bacterium]
MKNYRELFVWQKAHRLVLDTYAATRTWPSDELYGLTSQSRRSAASIPTNLAEGCGRSGDVELARFCDISSGSASELDYQLLLAHDLGYLSDETYSKLENQLREVRRMLSGLITTLRK